MGIDWFTFFAQVVNLLILIGLLWHFAYKPITRAMDEREQSIRQRLDEAERRRQEAEEKAQSLDEQLDELERQREQRLNEARDEAERRRRELLDEARQRVERSEAEWRAALERSQRGLAEELQRRSGRHLVAAARKLVADLADAELESAIVDVFARRLRDLDDEPAGELRNAVGEADGQVRVVSTFDLSDSQQQRLSEAVGALVGGEVQARFETDGDLLCGVEVHAGEQRVSWNAGEYLGELEERLTAAISEVARAESSGTPGNRQQNAKSGEAQDHRDGGEEGQRDES